MALMWIEGFETFGTTTGAGGAADALAGMKRKYGGSMTALQLAAGRVFRVEQPGPRRCGRCEQGNPRTGIQLAHPRRPGNRRDRS